MTKSREHGENEITDEAKREAARRGIHVCDVLAEMLAKAKKENDIERQRKIVRAQKYYGCRNLRERRKNP
jgi:hypothetical protein